MRCRELDIFKILGIFGNFFWTYFWNFSGGIVLVEFLWRNLLGEIFWEEFFGRIFLGGIFWGELFVYIGIDLFVKILVFIMILG